MSAVAPKQTRAQLEELVDGAIQEIDEANAAARAAEDAMMKQHAAYHALVDAIRGLHDQASDRAHELDVNVDILATGDEEDRGDNLLEAKRTLRKLFDAIYEIEKRLKPEIDRLHGIDVAAAKITPGAIVVDLAAERAKREA